MRDAAIIQARGQWERGVSGSLNMKYLLENAPLKITTIQFTSDIGLKGHLVPF